jgi:Family of unknown function (DUF6519)/Malectin domain
MSFDISRSTFRPRKNFLGVVMQQGRVQLDSDWNEWQSEYSRRIQAGTLDTFGQSAYPASTPNAFKITPSVVNGSNVLMIGAGRYYVDGLLAENHGPEAQATWDPTLAEMSGAPAYSTTTAETDYTKQPFMPPNTTLLPGNGPFLTYLDVWQRDITYLEDADLIDKAVNIDTTGRLQTVWQVKLIDLSNVSPAPVCSTDIPAFDALQQPPAGRLTNGLVPNATSGPCCLTPNTGYTGQENQLYRVEIHAAGAAAAPPSGGYIWPLPNNTPTFKWSRDDASVQTSVSAIATVGTVSQITVGSLGRDQVLGFAVNDWIEITDDAYEFLGQSGEFYQITATNPAANTITLNGTVSSHFVLTGGLTNATLHTRITRWDQSGQVYQTDSSGNRTPWINLNAPGSTGQIPVPPTGTMLELENGITVSFDLSPEPTAADPTAFRIGDYWLFTARTADGSVEPVTSAPPLGINHHYAKLSVVTFPGSAPDCRVPWPPEQSGCGCCCNIELAPTDLTGNTTLQSILNQHTQQTAQTTICLEGGTYSLPAPLRLTSAHANITIEACQPGSVIFQALAGNESNFNDGLIVIDGSTNITISGINFRVPSSAYSASTFAGVATSSLSAAVASLVGNLLISIGIRVVNGTTITIKRCGFDLGYEPEAAYNQNTALFAAGVFLNGANETLKVEDCEFRPNDAKLSSLQNSFVTGVAMASSVSFANSSTTIFINKPTNLTGVVEGVAQKAPVDTVQKQPVAVAAKDVVEKATAPAKTSAATEATLAASSSNLQSIERSGLQLIGGQLLNTTTFGNSATNFAAQGGNVLPATLDESILRCNTFIRLTAAALLLGEPGALDLSENTVEGCTAGFWIVTPSQAQLLLTDEQSLALVGATVALALPLPQGDTSTTTTVPVAPASVFIYTGSNPNGYKDSNGNQWTLDQNATSVVSISGNSWLYQPTNPAPTIASYSTPDPTLYQSERAGPSFTYTFTGLIPGYYTLILKFAEIYYTSSPDSGIRIFDVSINGVQVLTNFDIGSEVGPLVADDKIFSNIVPNSQGQIVVQFTGTSVGKDVNAKVNAVELDAAWNGSAFLGPNSETDSTLFFDQLAQVAEQAYLTASYSLAQYRIQDNQMSALRAAGLLLLGDDNIFNDNASTLIMTGNRIDGRNGSSDFNTFGEAQTFGTANKALKIGVKSDVSARALPTSEQYFFFYFSYMVVITSVSRAVVVSNIVANEQQGFRFGEALILDDSNVQNPVTAVTGNAIVGNLATLP